MYVCTKTEDSTLVGRAVLLLAVWRGLVSWRVVRGVASHARADNIDAGAGRGGEAHGRWRGVKVEKRIKENSGADDDGRGRHKTL